MSDIFGGYQQAIEKLRIEEEAINKLARDYSQVQINVILGTINKFVEFIRCTGRQVSQSENLIFDGLEFLVLPIQNYETQNLKTDEFTDYLKGGMRAAKTAAKYGGFPMLAWLGGGSLAAGGGGVVLGAVLLGSAAIIPVLVIGSVMLNQTIDADAEYEAKINQFKSDICDALDYAMQLKQRIHYLKNELESINSITLKYFHVLESQPFDSNRDAEKFQQVALLIKGIIEILKTPVLNSERKLNLGTVTILEKYRTLSGK
ncbi:hypothetical protein [Nostoc sp. 2RC]|uniref:hypothetical protein n=1 Tax=Nostoc sp. 2RC TaxID=2485484 RepID=UPI00162979D4|nr:hypothetical protein [Nostoc sp. 2RC]MBC1236932.1 hypothetical protein [Nostoc sp. 2RC]